MAKVKDFIRIWGGAIALCLIIIALIAAFITIECKWDIAFWRILGACATIGIAGIISVAAFMAIVEADDKWRNNK